MGEGEECTPSPVKWYLWASTISEAIVHFGLTGKRFVPTTIFGAKSH